MGASQGGRPIVRASERRRKGCIPDLVEDGTGETVQFPVMALSLFPLVRFGTSTWTYEGWQGQVYKREYTKSAFTRECLGEYCQYQYQGEPLFRTVGNDATFYRPPTANQLRHYLTQIPEDFQMCFKVWEEITIPTYAKQARYGTRAGHPNPRFLDAKLFNDLVLTPYREAKFEPHGSIGFFCVCRVSFGTRWRFETPAFSVWAIFRCCLGIVSLMSTIIGPACPPSQTNTRECKASRRHSRCCDS
jgi:hypothetical protein